jgi:hypothetical protein
MRGLVHTSEVRRGAKLLIDKIWCLIPEARGCFHADCGPSSGGKQPAEYDPQQTLTFAQEWVFVPHLGHCPTATERSQEGGKRAFPRSRSLSLAVLRHSVVASARGTRSKKCTSYINILNCFVTS